MVDRPLEFLYAGLRVRDVDRSLRFYQGLGFRVHQRGTMEHGGVWIHLRLPGDRHRLELNYYPKGNRFYEPFRRGTEFDHLGFRVRDVAGWRRRLRSLKAPIVADFTEEGQRLIYAEDPDGNWVEFFGPASPAKRRHST